MSFRPLWPAMPPPCLMRTVPGGKSSSSCTTRISSGAILKKPASICTARPARVHEGLRQQQPDAAPSCGRPAPGSWSSLRSAMPLRGAKRSTSQNPALCRVRSYSLPGLPRPTMSADPGQRLLLLFLRPPCRRRLARRGLAAGACRPPCRRPSAPSSAFVGRGRLLRGRHLARGRHGLGCGFLFLGDERRQRARWPPPGSRPCAARPRRPSAARARATCTEWPTRDRLRSTSMNSGRSSGRQRCRARSCTWLTMPPCVLHARRVLGVDEVQRHLHVDLLVLASRAGSRRAAPAACTGCMLNARSSTCSACRLRASASGSRRGTPLASGAGTARCGRARWSRRGWSPP